MTTTKYRNFGGSGKPFSRRPPQPRSECSFKGKKITSKKQLEAYLDGDSIQCLICGEYFQSVSSHVLNKHGVASKDYKCEFGIPVKTGLTTRRLKALSSAQWKDTIGMDTRKAGANSSFEANEKIETFKKQRAADYLSYTLDCSAKEISIYSGHGYKTSMIYEFAKLYKDESLIEALKDNEKFKRIERPSVEVICANKKCGKKFTCFASRSPLSINRYCCKSCSLQGIKNKRIEKPCKICGRVMLLTQGNFNRISTCCSSRTNSKAHGSAINFKD